MVKKVKTHIGVVFIVHSPFPLTTCQYISNMHWTVLHFIPLHWTVLHFILQHWTVLHFILLHWTVLHFIPLHWTAMPATCNKLGHQHTTGCCRQSRHNYPKCQQCGLYSAQLFQPTVTVATFWLVSSLLIEYIRPCKIQCTFDCLNVDKINSPYFFLYMMDPHP